jgi:hypothetical protein
MTDFDIDQALDLPMTYISMYGKKMTGMYPDSDFKNAIYDAREAYTRRLTRHFLSK